MKRDITKSMLILVMGVVLSASVFIWEKAQAFISRGLTESQKIRAAEAKSCSEEAKNQPQFNGCNSII